MIVGMSPAWFSSPASEPAAPGAPLGQSGYVCGSSAEAAHGASSDRPTTKASDRSMAEGPEEEGGPTSVQSPGPAPPCQTPGLGWQLSVTCARLSARIRPDSSCVILGRSGREGEMLQRTEFIPF